MAGCSSQGSAFKVQGTDSAGQLCVHFAAVQPHSLTQVPPPSIFAEPTKSLSVVIPAYNEEDRLAVALEDLIGYVDM